MFFRYFDTSASLKVRGDKFRLLASSPLCELWSQDDAVVEISFADWWGHFSDEVRASFMEGAPEGVFFMDWGEGPVPLSTETGEPVEMASEAAESEDSTTSEEAPE